MTLDIDIGDGADALTINQLRDALDGTYWVSGWDASVGAGDLEVDVTSGEGAINGGGVSSDSTQIVDFTGGPDPDGPRKAIISVDDTGTVQKTLGDAMPAEPTGEIRERTFNPAPPASVPGAPVAEVWLAAGTTTLDSADLRDRRVANNAVENYTVEIPTRGLGWAQDNTAPNVARGTYVEGIGMKIYEPILGVAFDTESRTWDDTLTPYPKDGKTDGAVGQAQDKIYVCGGRDADFNSQDVVYEYTPDSDSWTTVAPMPTARYDMTTAEHDGSLYLIGGQSSNSTFTDDVYRYDPSADSWTTLQSVPFDSFDSRAAVSGDKIYLAGIRTGFGEGNAEFWEYDISADAWTQLASMPKEAKTGGFVNLNGELIYAGGNDSNANNINDAFRYSIQRDQWTRLTPLPVAMGAFTAATVASSAYFMFGNDEDNNSTALNQTLFNVAVSPQ